MKLKYLAYLLPFIAVYFGLYLVKNAWVTTLIYHAGMLIILTNTGLGKRLIHGWHKKWALALIGGGLLVGIIFWILTPIIAPPSISTNISSLGLTGISLIVWAVYFSLVNPFFEEAFWRGYLLSDKKGIAGSDIFFAGYHVFVLILFIPVYWAILEFVILLSAAVLFRQCAIKTNGLVVPLLAHLTADIVVGLTIWLVL
ncbi:MAG: CPBP family glutamic-type intramembrane protease [Nanoarchaeota archaeon]